VQFTMGYRQSLPPNWFTRNYPESSGRIDHQTIGSNRETIGNTYGRPRSSPRFQRCTRSVLGHVFGVVLAHWKAPRLDEIRPWWPKRAIRDTYGRPRSIPRFQRCTRSVLGHVFGVVLALWKAPRLDEIRPWWPKQAFALVALVPERAVTSVA